MTLHLIKLCVGVDKPETLEEHWQAEWQAQLDAGVKRPEIVHHTRQFPRRSVEILDGGSLYWVTKGKITMRQSILNLRSIEDSAGKKYCEIVLDRTIMLVKPRRKRPFQGWRYLKAEDAPKNLYPLAHGGEDAGSKALKAELSDMGLI